MSDCYSAFIEFTVEEEVHGLILNLAHWDSSGNFPITSIVLQSYEKNGWQLIEDFTNQVNQEAATGYSEVVLQSLKSKRFRILISTDETMALQKNQARVVF